MPLIVNANWPSSRIEAIQKNQEQLSFKHTAEKSSGLKQPKHVDSSSNKHNYLESSILLQVIFYRKHTYFSTVQSISHLEPQKRLLRLLFSKPLWDSPLSLTISCRKMFLPFCYVFISQADGKSRCHCMYDNFFPKYLWNRKHIILRFWFTNVNIWFLTYIHTT